MTKNKKVTIIVPVYNMETYLERAVESLLSQTYMNTEIILVNDGSTDGGPKLCDEYERHYDHISVVHKKNGGLSSARNAGIAHASGDYIIFPDPDDWVAPTYIEDLVNLRQESDLEICGHYIVDANKKVTANENGDLKIMAPDEAIDLLVKSQYYCGFAWNKLFHLDIIRKVNLRFNEELGMAQDLEFCFRYMTKCQKIIYDPTPQYFYYQHEEGVTNINHPLTARKISGLKTYDKLLEMAKKDYPQVVPTIQSTIANINLHFLFIYLNSKMNDKALYRKLKGNFKNNFSSFIKNEHYSVGHKGLGSIAYMSPKIYFLFKKRRVDS